MKKVILLLLLLALLSGTATASEIIEKQTDTFGINDLLRAVPKDIQKATRDDWKKIDFNEGLKNIIHNMLDSSGLVFQDTIRMILRVLSVSILCCLLEGMGSSKGQIIILWAGVAGIMICCLADLRSIIKTGKETMDDIHNFSIALLPVVAAASAASGAVTSSTVLSSAATLIHYFLIRFCGNVLLPLIHAGIGFAIVGTLLQDQKLSGIQDLLSWSIKAGLKGVVYVVTGFLTISGVLAGVSDSAALKAAKVALSGMVPVVGGSISDAAGTVLASAQVLKASIGTIGMLSFLAIFAVPFFQMAIQYLGYRIAAALTMLLGSRLSRVLDGLAVAIGYMLAMTGSCLFIAMLSCFCFLRTVQV